jgi:tryptophan 2,3-dioxygenase
MKNESRCPVFATTSADEADGPILRFTAESPYDEYVHASLITSLQDCLTDAPSERAFLVATQVMELWFTLIISEWREARSHLRDDDRSGAMAALRRSVSAHEALNESWRPIGRMTPAQFNEFRAAFGQASGFQSVNYRHLEMLLGEKSKAMLQAHRGSLVAYRELEKSFREPSLYDEVLGFVRRWGMAMPDHVLNRDVTRPYQADPAVEEMWRQVYAGPQNSPLADLGEVLTDVAELVMRWRSSHIMAVRRAMGAKAGSAGSSGLAWLERRSTRPVFPELWSAREYV